MAIETTRRSILTGLIALVAAPAIVRAGSLMPVKQMLPVVSGAEFVAELPAAVNGMCMFDSKLFFALADGRIYMLSGYESRPLSAPRWEELRP